MSGFLELRGVEAGYGECQVLYGVDLSVGNGEVVTLVGRNGAGKTTTVRAIMGLTVPSAGAITIAGASLVGRAPEAVAQGGVALVPEGRQIFSNLTVRENLVAFSRGTTSVGAWTLSRVLDLFPGLARRIHNLGNELSGGEQQMLAIGRALLRNGRLLLVDEATEGLAPLIRAEIWGCLRRLKETGLSILVVDKHLEPLLAIADRHYIMERGRIVWTGSSHQLRSSRELWERHVGV